MVGMGLDGLDEQSAGWRVRYGCVERLRRAGMCFVVVVVVVVVAVVELDGICASLGVNVEDEDGEQGVVVEFVGLSLWNGGRLDGVGLSVVVVVVVVVVVWLLWMWLCPQRQDREDGERRLSGVRGGRGLLGSLEWMVGD